MRPSPQTGWYWCAAFALLLIAAFTGCSKKEQASGNPNEKRYPLTGEILAVDTQQNVLKVRHDEIKGYMPAMTMEFSVSPGDAANAKVGQRIRAELVTEGDGEFRLEKIWVEDPATRTSIESAAKALVQDTVARGKKAYREVGETIPEFKLLDQDGRVVDSSRFRGKQVMLNFIFTRCPVATMCPAAVARFQQVQRMAKEGGVTNLELVSITLDPEYDTPGVLKTYANTRAIDTSNYSLLTGPENAIKSLLSSFGVLMNFEGELLNHTLTTVLINEQGRIVHRADGSKWEAEEFVGKMKKA
jgi:protein SCO1